MYSIYMVFFFTYSITSIILAIILFLYFDKLGISWSLVLLSIICSMSIEVWIPLLEVTYNIQTTILYS
jgi:hypothetical protein